MNDLHQTNCKQISEMLSAFRDMELTLPEVDLVEAHLVNCAACRDELAAIEMVVASIQRLPEVQSKDFADLIEARILAEAPSARGVEAGESSSSSRDSATVEARPVVVGNNVVPFARRSNSKIIAFAAVAAVSLFAIVAQFTLSPPASVEVAQVPAGQSHGGATNVLGAKLETDKNSVPNNDDIVALYDEEGSNNGSDVGISTNEDGLYAIKL